MASNPHTTPQDTLAALRTRYTGELVVADAATPGPWFAAATDDRMFMNARYVTTKRTKFRHDGKRGMDTQSGEQVDHEQVVAITLLQDPRLASHRSCKWNEDTEFIAAARESVPRDARLKLALLDQVGRDLLPSKDEYRKYSEVSRSNGSGARDAAAICAVHGQALATLRLLAESAGEAVAW